jgi:hypothetical protein
MAADGAGLGLSLVDNPVALGRDDLEAAGGGHDESDDEDEELVELPAQLQRIGALLSTATGRPTMLYRLLVGALASLLPIYFSGALGGSPIWTLGLADVLQNSAIGVGLTLAGIPALRSLRHVTRPGGFLARMGADSARLPRSAVEELGRSKRRLACAGNAAVAGVAMFAVLGLFFGASDWVIFVQAAVGMLWCATVFGSAFTWWYSLKLAAALTAAPVAKVSRDARAEAKRMRKSGAPMDAERWRSLIEEPVLHLECEVLPVLSEGWGHSVLLVDAQGWRCLRWQPSPARHAAAPSAIPL